MRTELERKNIFINIGGIRFVRQSKKTAEISRTDFPGKIPTAGGSSELLFLGEGLKSGTPGANEATFGHFDQPLQVGRRRP